MPGNSWKQLESGGRIQAQAVGGQESCINRGPKSTLEKPDFSWWTYRHHCLRQQPSSSHIICTLWQSTLPTSVLLNYLVILNSSHSHLSGSLNNVGVFQSYKKNFKNCVWKEIFHDAKSISKPDFFSFFQTFSNKTFTANLYKSAFKKTNLILYNPSIVLDKMKVYDGV